MTDHILVFSENKRAHQQNLLSVLERDSRNEDAKDLHSFLNVLLYSARFMKTYA